LRYLLDVNALIALGITSHVFHDRIERWIDRLSRADDSLATCAITELAFVRIIPLLPDVGADVRRARELLRRLKRQTRLRFELLGDALGVERLPPWARLPRQTTDGHLIQLARLHAAELATLDGRIPGAFVVPS
jgi:predicted nucleic acid-binding protein